MTFTPEQVETIVLEVIRRLGLVGAAAGERSSTAADLVLAEKVVTLRLLDGRLTDITRVLVQPRAVVTPAVRDELNQRKIELVRQV